MCRGGHIEIIPVKTLQPDGVQLPQVVFRQQFFDNKIAAQPVRGRTEHRHLLGKSARSRQHFLGFGAIIRHTRLTKHVLAGLERRNSDGRMHVWRGADPNNVDIRQSNQIGPVGDRNSSGNIFLAKFLCTLVSGV